MSHLTNVCRLDSSLVSWEGERIDSSKASEMACLHAARGCKMSAFLKSSTCPHLLWSARRVCLKLSPWKSILEKVSFCGWGLLA